jgi:hypothetical protein
MYIEGLHGNSSDVHRRTRHKMCRYSSEEKEETPPIESNGLT